MNTDNIEQQLKFIYRKLNERTALSNLSNFANICEKLCNGNISVEIDSVNKIVKFGNGTNKLWFNVQKKTLNNVNSVLFQDSHIDGLVNKENLESLMGSPEDYANHAVSGEIVGEFMNSFVDKYADKEHKHLTSDIYKIKVVKKETNEEDEDEEEGFKEEEEKYEEETLDELLDGKAAKVHKHLTNQIYKIYKIKVIQNEEEEDIEEEETLDELLDGKSNVGHAHSISDITNLQTILDGKAASVHTHTTSDITNLNTYITSTQFSKGFFEELGTWFIKFLNDEPSIILFRDVGANVVRARIYFNPSASSGGLEFHTNKNRLITFKQYSDSGDFETLNRTLTLLDQDGNSTFPGTITVSSITLNGTDLATTLSGKASSVHDHTSADITNWATATENFAKTNVSNTFTQDQEIDGHLTITTDSLSTWVRLLMLLRSNMANGSNLSIIFGKSIYSTLCGDIAYQYYDTESNRRIKLGFESSAYNLIYIYPQYTEMRGRTQIRASESTGGYLRALQVFAPNLNTGNSLCINLGVKDNSRNTAHLNFNYVGDGSTDNNLEIALYGFGNIANFYSNKILLNKDTTVSTTDDGTWNNLFHIMSPNLSNNHWTAYHFGKSADGSNCAEFAYQYSSDTDDNKRIKIGFYTSALNSTYIYINRTEFMKPINLYTDNASSLNIYNNMGDNYIWIGKDNNAYNRAVFGYRGSTSGSTDNYGLLWFNADILKFFYNRVEILKPLTVSGDITMSGGLSMTNANPMIYMSGGTTGELRMKCGSNDYGRVYAGQTGSNAGYLEIATADDGAEPIYARQYTGQFGTLKRTATILDGSGNTSFPGTLNANGIGLDLKREILSLIYPVGSLYSNASDTRNPNQIFGFGTWTRISGYYLYAEGTDSAVGTSGGSINHTHSYGIAYRVLYQTVFGYNGGASMRLYNNGTWTDIPKNGSMSGNYNGWGGTSSGYQLDPYYTTVNTGACGVYPPYYRLAAWIRTA